MKPCPISILTVHPRFVAGYGEFGVLRAARDAKVAEVIAVDLRDFAVDDHGSVDDRPFGGGDGMVFRCEPLVAALGSLPERPRVILTSPSGELWTQSKAREWAAAIGAGEPLALVCGRFGGVDQRFIDRYVDEEVSVGDVILSGGELAALMIVDAALRLIPGVLGNRESAAVDSFAPEFEGGLEYPLYTRPSVFEGAGVPPVLLSGDHQAIARWRRAAVKERTALWRHRRGST